MEERYNRNNRSYHCNWHCKAYSNVSIIQSTLLMVTMIANSSLDSRKPSPPFGYSTVCRYPLEQQIHLVAEFHAHHIPANRIAYRLGIDLALIEKLLAGTQPQEQFTQSLSRYRKARRAQRLQQSQSIRGIGLAELQEKIETEYVNTCIGDKLNTMK